MDKDRVKQIIQSHTIIPVNYKGKPVYINQIDEQREVARVLPLDNLNRVYDVEISSLHEF